MAQTAANVRVGEGEEGSEKSTPRVQLQSQKQIQTGSLVRSEVALSNSWTSNGFDEDSGKITILNDLMLQNFLDATCDMLPAGNHENVTSETRDFELRSSDLQEQQVFETVDMPGYVPSPNSIRNAPFSTLSQSTKSVAAATAALSIQTAMSNKHLLKPYSQSANNSPADDCEHNNPSEIPENVVSAKFQFEEPNKTSSERFGTSDTSNAFKHGLSPALPAPATATASLDDNPALRLGQDEDPSVIKLVPCTNLSSNTA